MVTSQETNTSSGCTQTSSTRQKQIHNRLLEENIFCLQRYINGKVHEGPSTSD